MLFFNKNNQPIRALCAQIVAAPFGRLESSLAVMVAKTNDYSSARVHGVDIEDDVARAIFSRNVSAVMVSNAAALFPYSARSWKCRLVWAEAAPLRQIVADLLVASEGQMVHQQSLSISSGHFLIDIGAFAAPSALTDTDSVLAVYRLHLS